MVKITAKDVKKWCKENKLLLATIAGVVLGIALGFIMRSAKLTPLQQYYWGFPGDVVMMNMLKCIIIPLITLSITTGVASLAGNSGKLSTYAVLYYLTTTVVAIILGIVMSVIIKPGKKGEKLKDEVLDNPETRSQSVADGLLDIIRNMFAPNIVSAMFQQASSKRNDIDNPTGVNVSWSTSPSQNVLGLIVFFATFGYFLGKLASNGNEACKMALKIFNGLNDAVMELVDLVMWYVPVGLLFLVSKKIMSISSEDGNIWSALGFLILTSILSILIHAFIFVPAIYFAATRQNPYKFMAGVSQAIVTAFGNASSAATMPITLRNLETRNGISKKVTRFMIPLGATINMDGTALYEAVAALFIAQLNGIDLGFGKVVTIAVTATAASIGAAAVPSAGLITLIIVLTAVGLPPDDIAWIYTVDWMLDRFRTACNVWGDCAGCGVVQFLCREELGDDKELDFA